MIRGQRTNKDLQKSSPKSDLSVIEKLFSHIRELSVYFFFLLLTLSVPSEGYCRNAYMMWGFWCDCSLF
jgi:hypothetical protein